MRAYVSTLTPILVGFFLIILGAPWLGAQINGEIRAHIDHSFVIDNTTLPPGEYIFRMMPDTELSEMIASSEDGKTAVAFLVGEAIDNHTPMHSELVFRRYGNTEFLDKVFEGGTKLGAAVTETGREESRFVRQGQHPIEHTEEEK
jgi:hypothetical protein